MGIWEEIIKQADKNTRSLFVDMPFGRLEISCFIGKGIFILPCRDWGILENYKYPGSVNNN
jgi:hypothetical protein